MYNEYQEKKSINEEAIALSQSDLPTQSKLGGYSDEELTASNKILSKVTNHEWQQTFKNVLRDIPNTASTIMLKRLYEELDNNKDNRLPIIDNLNIALDIEKPKKEYKKKLVIVADDQPVMQKIIKTILETKNFRVEVASNGVELILKAKLMEPAVVLLDIGMPIVDGIDTLKVLSQINSVNNTRIIMLTSYADKDFFKSCIELGAVDYVVKPTKASILLNKVNKVMKPNG